MVCFFPTSTYTQFLCMIFGHHCHALLPGQKRRKRCSGTLFCFTMVIFRFALQRVLLGHSDPSCLCFLYSFLHSTSSLLFSRRYSGRNFARKDSVRMNGVLLVWLVYFQHQGSAHFLHMCLEITPFREVIVLEEGRCGGKKRTARENMIKCVI